MTPERRIEIQSVLQELSDYWHEYPELRLGQIVGNFTPHPEIDPYFIPDTHYFAALVQGNKTTKGL